jgi:hypothetical protein
MKQYSEAFVGFDTAKKKHAVAIADVGREGEIRYRLEARIVETLVVEMPVHAVEPRRDPAASAFRVAMSPAA